MSGFFDALERDLVAAAHEQRDVRAVRPRRVARRSARSLAVAVVLFVIVAGSAAAATLLAVRGARIEGPDKRDVGVELPLPNTAVLAPGRAADPEGGTPWALRTGRTRDGLMCTTVGQVVGGRFGLVGLDGRFRVADVGVVDSCGRVSGPSRPLIGVRVFDAGRRADVRSVVNGIAGPRLRGVTVLTGEERHRLPVRAGGTFLTVLRGYPEDLGMRVALTYAGGRRRAYPLGTSAFVVPDPAGGPAWQLQGYNIDRYPQLCVNFTWARTQPGAPTSSPACGLGFNKARARGYFFAVRRLEAGARGDPRKGGARWPPGTPPRTAVWGQAGADVRRVVVIGPSGPREARFNPGRAFLVVYDGSVDPTSLRVRVTTTDGRVRRYRGDTNLVRGPKP